MRPLAVIGNVNVDLILGPAAPWPKAGTETIVDHDELRVGGQAGNSALAWQALGVDFEIAANVGDRPVRPLAARGLRPPGRQMAGAPGRARRCRSASPIPMASAPSSPRAATCRASALPMCCRFSTASGCPAATRCFCGCLPDRRPDARTMTRSSTGPTAHRIAVALDTGWPIDGWTAANRDSVNALALALRTGAVQRDRNDDAGRCWTTRRRPREPSAPA